MAIRDSRFRLWAGAMTALLAVVAGCGGPPAPDTKAADSYQNMMTVIGAYLKATQKQGRPPTKVDEIRPFLVEFGDPDTMLRSPRDGEPYVIVWGVDIVRAMDRPPTPIVMYEKTGKDGKRYVARGRMVFDVTEDEFKQLPFPPGHKVAS